MYGNKDNTCQDSILAKDFLDVMQVEGHPPSEMVEAGVTLAGGLILEGGGGSLAGVQTSSQGGEGILEVGAGAGMRRGPCMAAGEGDLETPWYTWL